MTVRATRQIVEGRVVRIRHCQSLLQVTGHTGGRRALVDPTTMAFNAIESAMGPTQREPAHGMFKFRVFPELLAVTISAVRQGAIVDVILLMAHQAVAAHAGEFTAIHVAFRAAERVVHSRQREVLVKITGLVPIFFIVAFDTTVAELTIVHVFMAVHAVHSQRLITNHRISPLFISDFRPRDGFVTLFAFELFMSAAQFELALFVMYKLSWLPALLVMTFRTVRGQLAFVVIRMALDAAIFGHLREEILAAEVLALAWELVTR